MKDRKILKALAVIAAITLVVIIFAIGNKSATIELKKELGENTILNTCKNHIEATGDFNSRYCEGINEDDSRLGNSYEIVGK